MMSIIREIFTKMHEVNLLRQEHGLADIVDLTLGQPHFPVNPIVVSALNELVKDNSFKHMLGYSEVAGKQITKTYLARYFQDWYPKCQITSDNVLCCNGANQANWNALSAILSSGDEAITFAPFFGQYQQQLDLLNVKLHVIQSEFCNFRADLNMLDHALYLNNRIKCVILNNPTNPSGVVWHTDEIKQLVHILQRHPEVIVLQDEVYHELSYTPYYSLLDIAPELMPRIITTTSFSKAVAGAPGLRLGMALADKSFIQKMKQFQMAVTAEVSAISQYVIAALIKAKLDRNQAYISWVEKSTKEFRSHLNYVIQKMSPMPFTICTETEAGFFVMINLAEIKNHKVSSKIVQKSKGMIELPEVISNDLDIVHILMTAYGLACIPGQAFGLDSESCIVRLSLAVSQNDLETTMKALAEFCADVYK